MTKNEQLVLDMASLYLEMGEGWDDLMYLVYHDFVEWAPQYLASWVEQFRDCNINVILRDESAVERLHDLADMPPF